MLKYLVLLLFTIAYTQDFLKLFSNDLNKLIHSDDYFKEFFITEAQEISTIDPNLLAYLIDNINLRYNENKNLLRYIRKKKNILELRSKWAEKKIYSIENFNKYDKKTVDIYKNLILDPAKYKILASDNYFLENNYIDYIVYKFYKNDLALSYKHEENYQAKRNGVELSLISKVSSDISKSLEAGYKINFDGKYYKYIYLFSDNYLTNSRNKLKFSLIDILIKGEEKQEIVNESWSYSLSFEMMNKQAVIDNFLEQDLLRRDNYREARNFVKFTVSHDIKDLLTLSVNKTFSVPYFRSLDVGAYYGVSFSKKTIVANNHIDYNTAAFQALQMKDEQVELETSYHHMRIETGIPLYDFNYQLKLKSSVSIEWNLYHLSVSESGNSNTFVYSNVVFNLYLNQQIFSFLYTDFGLRMYNSFGEELRESFYPYLSFSIKI